MASIVLLNKPFQVLSQFSDKEGRSTLKDYVGQFSKHYPAGRLDYDSEGLILLTDDGQLQHRISNPKHKLSKTYWAQVEGEISEEALSHLCSGVTLNDGPTKPAKVRRLSVADSDIWPRTPPIRERKNQPTSWVELIITEGRNRQVRRMTAEVGFPTLRLIRVAIGTWSLDGLQPGQFRQETIHLPKQAQAPRKKRYNSSNSTQKNAHKHKR